MPQEQTEKTLTPDSDLQGGKVRPKSKVKVVFLDSKHHITPFYVESIHPSLAEKLLAQGKIRMGGTLSKEEKDANKQALEDKVKAKGRKPGKKEEPLEEEDLDGGGDEGKAGKEKAGKQK